MEAGIASETPREIIPKLPTALLETLRPFSLAAGQGLSAGIFRAAHVAVLFIVFLGQPLTGQGLPSLGRGRRPRFAFRFKRMIHLVDSTTLQLVANCMDWAKHRRRKAAAKCHLRLNLQSFLPRFAIVDPARHSDAKKAWEMCAGLLAGEIAIFDKAYLDLLHLFELFKRGVCWVTRAKEGIQFRVVRCYQRGRIGNILRDDLVQMKSSASRRLYPA